ncbi:unnamed protein product [Arabidopsis halleri]
MMNSFQLSFTVLTIFIVCVYIKNSWKGQLPNGQCSLSLPVGANGKCVSKDCDSSCQHKYKGRGSCLGHDFNECICFVCRRPRS